MTIFLVIGGSWALIYGLLTVFGKRRMGISGEDKKLSEKERRFWKRYAGLKLIIAGIGAIALGSFIYIDRHTFSAETHFVSATQLVLPVSATDIRYEENFDNWLGDGRGELSFLAATEDVQRLLSKKPFGEEWLKGPYEDFAPYFAESHQIENGDAIFYQTNYTGPSDSSNDRYLIILDSKNSIVLLQEYHS